MCTGVGCEQDSSWCGARRALLASRRPTNRPPQPPWPPGSSRRLRPKRNAPAPHSSRCTHGRCTATPGSCGDATGSREPGLHGTAVRQDCHAGAALAQADVAAPRTMAPWGAAPRSSRGPTAARRLSAAGKAGGRGGRQCRRISRQAGVGSHPPSHRRRAAPAQALAAGQASPADRGWITPSAPHLDVQPQRLQAGQAGGGAGRLKGWGRA